MPPPREGGRGSPPNAHRHAGDAPTGQPTSFKQAARAHAPFPRPPTRLTPHLALDVKTAPTILANRYGASSTGISIAVSFT